MSTGMATTQAPRRGSTRQRPPTAEGRRAAARRRQIYRRRRLTALAVVLAGLAFLVLFLGGKIASPSLETDGPADDAAVGAEALAGLAFAARSGDSASIDWSLDGKDVTAAASVQDGVSILRPGASVRRTPRRPA